MTELAVPTIARGNGKCSVIACRANEGEPHHPGCPDYRPAPFGVAHCSHCSIRPRPDPGQPVEWGRERCPVGGCVSVVNRDATDRLIADLRACRAEVERLNYEIMGYQVRDGYDKGYEHGQAAAVAEVLKLRAERDELQREVDHLEAIWPSW